MNENKPSINRTALVTGFTGQDGYYLVRLLIERGYRVTAGAPDVEAPEAREAARKIPDARLVAFDLARPETIDAAVDESRPDEVYHLAGISHIPTSWDDPALVMEINAVGTLHLMKAVERAAPEAHLVFAGSGDVFNHEAALPGGVTPQTPYFCPNPYAVSKAAAMQMLQCYREEYCLRASTAVLMNHTSPRRPRNFVERKIVAEAVETARGERDKLTLGSLETRRDWSWAEDIVEGLAALGAHERPGDYVFASGRTHTTGDWVRLAFRELGLDPEKRVEIDPSLLHRRDRPHTFGDIGPTRAALGWSPRTDFETMVRRMVRAELKAAPARDG